MGRLVNARVISPDNAPTSPVEIKVSLLTGGHDRPYAFGWRASPASPQMLDEWKKLLQP